MTSTDQLSGMFYRMALDPGVRLDVTDAVRRRARPWLQPCRDRTGGSCGRDLRGAAAD